MQRHDAMIPKSLHSVHLEQNVEMVKLSEEQTERIDSIADHSERGCRRFCPAEDPQADTVPECTYEQLS